MKEIRSKLFNRKLNILNYVWLIIVLSYIPISGLFILYGKMPLKVYANIFYILNIVSLILCVLNYVAKKKLNSVDLVVLLLIILADVATICSNYRDKSLWGQPGRYEGMFMLITYYVLYILSTFVEKNDKKKIVACILVFGVMQVGVGILQQFNLMPIINDGTKYSGGLVGNSNYFSTQNIMWLALSLGLFLFSKKWWPIVLVIIFSVGLALGGAMSCFVGLICVILSIVIILIVNRKYLDVKKVAKKFVLTVLLIVASYVIVGTLTDSGIGNDIKGLFIQANDIVINKNTDDTYGTFRLYIWKNTLPKVKDYLWTGVGIDCFRYIFKPYLRIDGGIVGKAHNEYLQLIITEGVFALLAYLILLFINVFNNYKNSRSKEYDYLDYAILLSVIGYITQAFFNISVIRVAPMFFVLMGLSYNRDALKIEEKKTKRVKKIA